MPSNITNYFSVGDIVEVTNNPRGSYFEATIISRLVDNSYVVEYTELLNDDDEDSLFTEAVSINDLRPKPPPVVVPAIGFSPNQKVDAYENEGWWYTTIIRRDLNSNYYFVRCVNGDDEVMVRSSQLRIHQDWIDGRWVLP